MKIEYYQRLVPTPNEYGWDYEYGPGLWVETYRKDGENGSFEHLVQAYLVGKTQPQVIDVEERGRVIVEWFVSKLAKVSLATLAGLVRSESYLLAASVENVPQLSSYELSTSGLIDILQASTRKLDFVEIGYHLNPNGATASVDANRKFGENCAKFAALLGLVEIPCAKAVVLSSVGRAIQSRKDRDAIYPRLFFRLELFRDLVFSCDEEPSLRFSNVIDSLAKSTQERRASAFSIMCKKYSEYGGEYCDKDAVDQKLWRMRHYEE